MTWTLFREEEAGFACDHCVRHVGNIHWVNESGDAVCSLKCGEEMDRLAVERAMDSDHDIPEGYHEQ